MFKARYQSNTCRQLGDFKQIDVDGMKGQPGVGCELVSMEVVKMEAELTIQGLKF